MQISYCNLLWTYIYISSNRAIQKIRTSHLFLRQTPWIFMNALSPISNARLVPLASLMCACPFTGRCNRLFTRKHITVKPKPQTMRLALEPISITIWRIPQLNWRQVISQMLNLHRFSVNKNGVSFCGHAAKRYQDQVTTAMAPAAALVSLPSGSSELVSMVCIT